MTDHRLIDEMPALDGVGVVDGAPASDIDVHELLRPLVLDLTYRKTAIDRVATSDNPMIADEGRRLNPIFRQLSELVDRFEKARVKAVEIMDTLHTKQTDALKAARDEMTTVMGKLTPLREALRTKISSFTIESAKYGIVCEPEQACYEQALAEKAGAPLTEAPIKPETIDRPKKPLVALWDIIASIFVGSVVGLCMAVIFTGLTYYALRVGKIPGSAIIWLPIGWVTVFLLALGIRHFVEKSYELEMKEGVTSLQKLSVYGCSGALVAACLGEMVLEAMALKSLADERLQSAARLGHTDHVSFAALVTMALIVTLPYFLIKWVQAYGEVEPRVAEWRAMRKWERDIAEWRANRAKAIAAIDQLCHPTKGTPHLRSIAGIVAEIAMLQAQIEPLEAQEQTLDETITSLEADPELPTATVQNLVTLRTRIETLDDQISTRLAML